MKTLIRNFTNSTFYRFLLVGASNTIVSFLTFQIMLGLTTGISWSAGLSQAISYLIGLAWGFIWNKNWTFPTPSKSETLVFRYISWQLLLLSSTTALLHWAVDVNGFDSSKAWLLIMFTATAVNYYGMKKLVFRVDV